MTDPFAREVALTLLAALAPLCNAVAGRQDRLVLPVRYPEETVRRYWANVAKGDDNACWPWNGTLGSHGYGRFTHGKKEILAHRFAYEIATGPAPAGLSVLHACDNRRCQNPRHLRLGSQKENVADTVRRHRHHHGESHGNALLTDDAVRHIRQSDETITALARHYRVSRAAIRNARAGKSWRHVD